MQKNLVGFALLCLAVSNSARAGDVFSAKGIFEKEYREECSANYFDDAKTEAFSIAMDKCLSRVDQASDWTLNDRMFCSKWDSFTYEAEADFVCLPKRKQFSSLGQSDITGHIYDSAFVHNAKMEARLSAKKSVIEKCSGAVIQISKWDERSVANNETSKIWLNVKAIFECE